MSNYDDNLYKPLSSKNSQGIGLRNFSDEHSNSVSGASVSKRREFRKKRNKIRRIFLITLSIIIGIFLALVATDIVKIGTGPRPSLESSTLKKNLLQTQL